MALSPAPASVLTVTQLTALIKGTLAESFPAVWVKGELSGFRRYGTSGHLYFNLKDGGALLNAVMWRSRTTRLAFEPRDGMEAEAFGAITVYEARGQYQIVVEEMRPAGMGALLLALEELKRRLAAEGLFASERKRPLPRFPARVGLVTSPVGAAVRDMVKCLRQRWPSIGIVLAPVRVQGEGAAAEVAAAIERFNRYGRVDVLLVGRGGGSIEDLWAFNEEAVVRAIAGSRIPVISAVGHEVDVTLADLAADVRASTPSNAAERAVPVRAEVARRVRQCREQLDRAARALIRIRRERLGALLGKYGFRRQEEVLESQRQHLDELLDRMCRGAQGRLAVVRARHLELAQRYGLREWPRALGERRARVARAGEHVTRAGVQAVLARRTRLSGFEDRLRALSPRRVLERGYCLTRGPDGTLLRSVEGLAVGDALRIEFARGEADARVEAVRPGGTHG